MELDSLWMMCTWSSVIDDGRLIVKFSVSCRSSSGALGNVAGFRLFLKWRLISRGGQFFFIEMSCLSYGQFQQADWWRIKLMWSEHVMFILWCRLRSLTAQLCQRHVCYQWHVCNKPKIIISMKASHECNGIPHSFDTRGFNSAIVFKACLRYSWKRAART